MLSRPGKIGPADMAALQTDTRDFLASEIVPALLQALSATPLNTNESAARDLLTAWDYRMEINSAAASVWSTFWDAYLSETFDPWWKSRSVKVQRSDVNDMLGQDLEAWTLNDPANRAFSAPGVGSRTAADAESAAFRKAVASLQKRLGADPRTWTWGRIHTRELVNLALISGLSYGPRPDRGDGNTPLAAHGSNSTAGPSWRMVVDWGTRSFQAVYPGGQSGNPASSWYTNRVDTWWDGRLDPMLGADESSGAPGVTTWSLHP